MKKISLVVMTLVSGFALASGQPTEPNSFACVGPENTQLNYDTTSFSGRPLFHVSFKGETAKLPAFPEINIQGTTIGELVSVTDSHLTLVDGPSIHYSLLLPNVTLNDQMSQEKFETYVIRTTTGNPFFHPMPFSGASQSYDIVPVECTASFVVS